MSAELPTSKTQCICPEGLKGFELHCRSCHPDEQPSSNALFNRMWLDYCDSGPCDRAAAFKRIVGTEIERLQQDNARYENGRVVLTGEIDRLRMAERHNVHTVAKLQQERDQLRIKYANMFSALNAKQAKIDALMLEFCPGEMSAEQRAEWTQAQRSPPEPSPSASNDEMSNERLVELLASCIFQSECGGHADGYIAFLCDVATVCMELQRRRAVSEPEAATRPDGMPEPSLDVLKRVSARLRVNAPDTAYLTEWAVEQIEEHDASFDLRWKADMRAIELWQKAHPGNELVWPDHADLCVWLLEQLDAARASQPPFDGLFDQLKAYLLDQEWHNRCEIIPDYMPPYPRPETRPTVQVRYNDGSEHPPFLRHSAGPKQGFFWDIYGDDMQNIPLAVIAISQAPYPRSVGPITFRIPLPTSQTKSGDAP